MSVVASDPHPFADFIVQHLLKSLPEGAGAARAVSETEKPLEGDSWFWADDNAKVLELLALPDVWRRHPAAVEDVTRFLLTLCEGPFIFRRLALPRLEVREGADGRAEISHSLMNVRCDLSKGLVDLAVRFHDGRTTRNVRLTGNYVRFSHGGRVHVVDVEDHIVSWSIERDAGAVHLAWRSELFFFSGRAPLHKRRRLGLITYSVRLRAGSMLFECDAQLDLDPGIEVSDVTMTIGHDDLSHNDSNVRYEAVRTYAPQQRPVVFTADRNVETRLESDGASYWCIAQTSQIGGFALALHSRPRDRARLAGIRLVCNDAGRLHWVTSEHTFPGPHRGGTLSIAEQKVLTCGGFYDLVADYAALLASDDRAGRGAPVRDLSTSYDYGAELAALARCVRSLSDTDGPSVVRGLRHELRAGADRLFEVYETLFIDTFRRDNSAIFSRSLAFLAFAYCDMLIATGERGYAERLRDTCQTILSFERQNRAVNGSMQSGFLMGCNHDALPYVDCHASCLLALVRATELLDDPLWLPSIDRGLAAYCIDTVSIGFQGKNHKEDLVGVDYLAPDGVRHTMHTFWNFTSGLSLRLFNALRAARHPGLRDLWAEHATRITAMEWLMRNRIQRSLRPRDGSVEILTSVLSGETNSETQPWVALGLSGRV